MYTFEILLVSGSIQDTHNTRYFPPPPTHTYYLCQTFQGDFHITAFDFYAKILLQNDYKRSSIVCSIETGTGF